MHDLKVVDNGVNKTVNLANRTCTCYYWQLDEFPCSHAIVAMWKKKLNPLSFVSPYYTREYFVVTYTGSLYPIEDKLRWNVPQELKDSIEAPNIREKAGRPKKKRYKSGTEDLKNLHCGKCGRNGHNNRTCLMD